MQTQGKLVVAGLTGGEMDSFLQVAEVLFKERVSDPQELECWWVHVDIIQLLQQDGFDAHDLNKLEKATKRWKHLMVKLYGDVVDEQKQPASLRKKQAAQEEDADEQEGGCHRRGQEGNTLELQISYL